MIQKTTSSKGIFISQAESVKIQGFAVMLMVWHHLFAFPERVSVPYVLAFDSLAHIETMLSYFGRICIAVFAFCSGYGMQKKAIALSETGANGALYLYREVMKRLFKFYKRFWTVFFVFVPLGFILGVYSFQLLPFLKGALGFSSLYNAEWWYISYYVRFLLLFPLLNILGDVAESKCPVLLHILMGFFVLGLTLMPQSASGYSFLSVLICFAEGMYFVRTSWYERAAKTLHHETHRLAVGTGVLAAVFVARAFGATDFLLVPFAVFGLTLLLKNKALDQWLGTTLRVTGKYSTYIWLTHTFFAYYYFQRVTYLPRYSWLIAVWCIILCICSGIVLEQLAARIDRYKKRKTLKSEQNYDSIQA